MKTIFQEKIISWYEQNKRSLPWRNTQNPYLIWLSEVILQQTRVAQGLEYYLHFVQQFPTLNDLAQAKEQDVLKLWQGLGYYSRARNLLSAAKSMNSKYNGKMPDSYHNLLCEKGIGEYTAAAIASFAYNQPHAVVDGNVYRVLSRLFDINIPINTNQGKKYFLQLAQSLLPEKKANIYNQAIMEFGALQCTPKNPDCIACPLIDFCVAFANKTIEQRPVKEKKSNIKHRFFNYFFLLQNKQFYIQQRTQKDIWQHLYELPLIETKKECDISEISQLIDRQWNIKSFTIKQNPIKFKHTLSHQQIHATFFSLEIEQQLPLKSITQNQLQDFPISRLTELFFEKKHSFK